MSKPNLFIIGAPKCGTTSLASWLSDHPNIFMSPVKEPHYFDSDHKHSGITGLANYNSLFEKVGKTHLVVGEASTRYLISNIAVDNILEYNQKAKFVVCLRNPVEMAYSLHQQEVFAGIENIETFEKAWALQENRKNGKDLPYYCKDPIRLQYGKMCSLGTQCENLLKKISKDKVHFILIDDLKRDVLSTYKSLLRYLEVDYDGRTTFEAKNTSKTYRSKLFQQIILVLSLVKRKLGIDRGTGIYKWNIKKSERIPLTKEMRYELEKYFKPEILKLEWILERDLSHWFKLLNKDSNYNKCVS